MSNTKILLVKKPQPQPARYNPVVIVTKSRQQPFVNENDDIDNVDDIEDTDDDLDYVLDDLSDSDKELTVNDDNQKIKVILSKKTEKKSYDINFPRVLLNKVPHEPVKLPKVLNLKTFYYNNTCYWLEQQTGYLFLPNRKVEPIGRLIDMDSQAFQNGTNYQLSNRKIIWYYRPELV